MRLLTHHHLDTHRVKSQFAKLQQAVARDEFQSPNLKKLSSAPYWRFKLDQTHRLLVQFIRHGDPTVSANSLLRLRKESRSVCPAHFLPECVGSHGLEAVDVGTAYR